jgi:hypothetical protein
MDQFKLVYKLPLSGEHKQILYATDKYKALVQFIKLWSDVSSITPEIVSITQISSNIC